MATANDAPRVVAQRLVDAFTSSEERVDYLIANAPFMNTIQLCKLLKCPDYVLFAAAKQLNIPLNTAYMEIPMACVIKRLKAVPPNAIVRNGNQGTIVILPAEGDQPRRVHHFSGGEIDMRRAQENSGLDSPTDALNKVWL